MTDRSAVARLGSDGRQTVDVVVRGGYRPDVIRARAGVPLRLRFWRTDDDPCTERVVFSSPRLERRLARRGVTAVDLPGQPPGAIRFTCGMGRYRARIELSAAPRASLRSAIERRLGRAAGTARDGASRASSQPPLISRSGRRATLPGGERAIPESGTGSDSHGGATMSEDQPKLRHERREAAREAARLAPRRRYDYEAEKRSRRIRRLAFGAVAAIVLVVGGYLAVSDLLGQRGASSTGAIPVRLSMAGFTPSEIKVPAGQTVSIELWTTDAAPHLHGGVHTMISDELGIYEELRAADLSGESRRVVTLTTPTKPGTYDIYCNTCCGGKDSPQMHGKLTVEA